MPTGYAGAMSDTAVLVIDMLNAYRHPDAELLTPNGADIIDPIAGLIRVARDHEDVDLIYVNDNYGDFTAGSDDIVRSALDGERSDLVKRSFRRRAATFSPRRGTVFSAPPRWTICSDGWTPSG